MTEFLLWLDTQPAIVPILLYLASGGVIATIVHYVTDFDSNDEPVSIYIGLFWPFCLFCLAVVVLVYLVFVFPRHTVEFITKYSALVFHWIMIRYYKWKYNVQS